MLDVLNNNEILDEYVLSKIIRYNHRYRLQDENVAAHSFYVSLFCLKIMAKLNLDHETERRVLIIAILHDTPESKTSDIPHDVKVNYPEIRAALWTAERNYYISNWAKYLDELSDDDIASIIVKLADAYSVYQYCLNEKILGNSSNEIYEISEESFKRAAKYTNQINNLLKEKEN